MWCVTSAPSSWPSPSPSLLTLFAAQLIWSAALASCAIPGVFEAVELMSKDRAGRIVPYYSGSVKWSDGSITADLPMRRLAELFNVNHFIVSQVNPHVLPLVRPFLNIRKRHGIIASLITYLGNELRDILLNVSAALRCCRCSG